MKGKEAGMARILLHLDIDEDFHAGSKAMKDCETVLMEKKYELLKIRRQENSKGIMSKIQNELQFLKFFSLKKEDTLVVQHPLYIGTRYMKWLKTAKTCKGYKVIFIIHDLESLRKLFQDFEILFQQLDYLMYETSDVLIVHNHKMSEYLIEKKKIDRKKIVCLEVFDYLTDEKPESEKETVDIVIAGNLDKNKSGYIYEMAKVCPNLKINLYGIHYNSEKASENLQHQGAYPPDILPGKMKGKFGLVWDGKETETCAGSTGEYIRYNNPHKVSLYIAAEKPILIWKEAALAAFVEENNIGIAIKNLAELESILGTISEEEYANMKKNIKKMAEKVRNGGFMTKAIETAEQIQRQGQKCEKLK